MPQQTSSSLIGNLQDAHRTQHHATLLSVCYPTGRNYQWSSLAAHADFLVVMAYDMQASYCIMCRILVAMAYDMQVDHCIM
jgi:hypothetical protein